MVEAKDEMLELTLDELSEFDGSNGDVIYVAVDGVIYDVSNLSLWKGGQHKQGISAGKDLTKEIKELSPHGTSMLDRATIVGNLVE
ncbi:MAG: cytochrome b5 domain-containing protein [Acidaminobacteraceae bacterium]